MTVLVATIPEGKRFILYPGLVAGKVSAQAEEA